MNKLVLTIAIATTAIFSSSAFAQNAERGKELFNTCIQCHAADGNGVAEKKAPRLSGQHDWYVLKQLQDFKSGVRKNPDMDPYIKSLSEQDFKDLAAYIITL